MMTTDKMEWEERIWRNAQLSYQKAKLPPRMEMHEKIQKQKQELESQTSKQNEDSKVVWARDVPDFDKL